MPRAILTPILPRLFTGTITRPLRDTIWLAVCLQPDRTAGLGAASGSSLAGETVALSRRLNLRDIGDSRVRALKPLAQNAPAQCPHVPIRGILAS